mmetsp:Transcript_12632/g.58404  ORF Transcript_12632/g.58404 Transcript_12632/m.58404 type:complete len:254 (-) Transcript_12632:507-1268(-)
MNQGLRFSLRFIRRTALPSCAVPVFRSSTDVLWNSATSTDVMSVIAKNPPMKTIATKNIFTKSGVPVAASSLSLTSLHPRIVSVWNTASDAQRMLSKLVYPPFGVRPESRQNSPTPHSRPSPPGSHGKFASSRMTTSPPCVKHLCVSCPANMSIPTTPNTKNSHTKMRHALPTKGVESTMVVTSTLSPGTPLMVRRGLSARRVRIPDTFPPPAIPTIANISASQPATTMMKSRKNQGFLRYAPGPMRKFLATI